MTPSAAEQKPLRGVKHHQVLLLYTIFAIQQCAMKLTTGGLNDLLLNFSAMSSNSFHTLRQSHFWREVAPVICAVHLVWPSVLVPGRLTP